MTTQSASPKPKKVYKKKDKAIIESSPVVAGGNSKWPVTYTMYREDIVDEICIRIASGESLAKITGDHAINKNNMTNPNMPTMMTVCRWLDKYEDFRRRYARAREIQSEILMDQLVDIADDAANDMIEKTGRFGRKYMSLNREHVERARLRVDARKWAISKLYARKYGERTLIEHTGAVGSFDLTKMKTDDLEQLERILSGAAPDGGNQE